jgi:hypothetical protein
MRETAYLMARLRASRTLSLGLVEQTDVDRALQAAGHRLIAVTDREGRPGIALGWAHLAEPDPEVSDVAVQRLAPSALTTLAVCVGLCWPDVSSDPYPGEATTVGDVLCVSARRHVHDTWAKAALFHELPNAGYVELSGTSAKSAVNLGPAVATWPSGQLMLLRRAHDRLPNPEQAS